MSGFFALIFKENLVMVLMSFFLVPFVLRLPNVHLVPQLVAQKRFTVVLLAHSAALYMWW